MISDKKKIVLCMGMSSETDKYEKYLIENDFVCEILQVLHFEFVNLDELQKHLADSQSYSGLILTSPRAATAIAMIKMQNSFSMEAWLDQPIFCIGQATEFVTKEQIGLINILGTHTGNAKNLAKFIIKTIEKDNKKPLLQPCSDIAHDTISQILSEEKIMVQKIVVYKTKAHDSLKKNLDIILKTSVDVLVFFSPSIVENIIIALNNEISILKKFKIVAIGPVTESALLNAKIKVHGVAEKPEPRSLIEVINKINN